MTHHTDTERADFEAWLAPEYSREKWHTGEYTDDTVFSMFAAWQAARRAPVVPETIEHRAKKLKGLRVLIGATSGVPEAIALARSRFVEAYGRSPLHDDLAYACLLIDAYGGAPAVPVISEAQVLAITTAYEQGVGKGHQSHTRKEAITNPYSDEWGCDSAWQMGYDEGREQAERKAAAPQPPEAEKEDAWTAVRAHVASNLSTYRRVMEKRAAAPQPPDAQASVSNGTFAAPVQLSEPAGWIDDGGIVFWNDGRKPNDGEIIYTEQQVRQLLASHGIEVAP